MNTLNEQVRRKIEQIASMPIPKVKSLDSIPIGVYMQEAKNLYHWSVPDKAVLAGTGLSMELLDDIPLRVEALSETQAAWEAEKKTKNAHMERWKNSRKAALEFRSKIVHTFYFAFRNDEFLTKKVREILKYNDTGGFVQSFFDLHTLGAMNLEYFEGLSFDPAQLDEFVGWKKEIQKASSLADVAGKTESKTKPLRDRAFVHLKEAVDEVRVCGRFAFKGNAERLAGYRSTYLRQKNLQQKVKQKARKAEIKKNETLPGKK
ncbi:MAG: hypothetical protein GY765_10945 [bacterium]|nr:hypothetical protein [bacterium]